MYICAFLADSQLYCDVRTYYIVSVPTYVALGCVRLPCPVCRVQCL